MEKDNTVTGYPKELNNKSWRGLSFKSIDSALFYKDQVFMFKDMEYSKYSMSMNKIASGYPMFIDDKWKGILPVSELDGEMGDTTEKIEPESKVISGNFSLDSLKEISELDFVEIDSLILAGKGRGEPDEYLDNLGIALTFEQNNYWQDNRYSAKEYKVTKGLLKDNQNRIPSIEAFKISKPVYSVDYSFAASKNVIYRKFESKEN